MKRSAPLPTEPTTGHAARLDRNRSLERGVSLLRAFRPGADLLGNGELAERTGLSRSTVSRLTQTLVDCGWLEHDGARQAYRLAPAVLSLAHTMKSGSPGLQAAGPLMRQAAEQRRINVGLAAADGDDMVYLESVRYSRRVAWRNVVAGQRVPIERTSLGRAWLAALDTGRRARWLDRLRGRTGAAADGHLEAIAAAIDDVRRVGYCWASWQPQVVALATPIVAPGHSIYVLNMSVSDEAEPARVVEALHEPLLTLAGRISARLDDDDAA